MHSMHPDLPSPMRPAAEFELRRPPTLVVALLAAVATLLTLRGELATPAGNVLLYQLALYAAAGALWALAAWRRTLAAWAAPFLLAALLLWGLLYLQAPALWLAWPLVPLAAAALLGPGPAALFAALCAALCLLLVAGRSTAGAALAESAALVTALTGVGLWAAMRPYGEALGWLGSYFRQASAAVDEARTRRAAQERAVADLARAHRDQELLNERLDAMRAAAETAYQAKADFVAHISHEFRTPLNIIIGLIDLLTHKPELYGDPLPSLLADDLKIVQRNASYLSALINDVLDMTQTETGRLQLHPTWADLGEDIRSVAEAVRPLATRKNIALTIELPDSLPAVYCDRARIRQVVLNLASNAVRYTATGEVRIALRTTGDAAENAIEIVISDTGPGIPANELERIFEPFYQSSHTAGERREGSGLGLTISRHIVVQHAGRLWAESALNRGSRFICRLPISPPRPAGSPRRWLDDDWAMRTSTEKPTASPVPYRRRVVVCDRHGSLAAPLAHSYAQVETVSAADLDQALALAQTTPAHLLLLACDDAGWLVDAVSRARAALPDTPVAGCRLPLPPPDPRLMPTVGSLTKPVLLADLRAALDRCDPLHTVLVADDNADAQRIFTEMLRIVDPAIRTLTAADGVQALALLRQEQVDLLLLDVVMPVMDGWALLARLDAEGIRLPVLLISAEETTPAPPLCDLLIASVGRGLRAGFALEAALKLGDLLAPSPQPDPALRETR